MNAMTYDKRFCKYRRLYEICGLSRTGRWRGRRPRTPETIRRIVEISSTDFWPSKSCEDVMINSRANWIVARILFGPQTGLAPASGARRPLFAEAIVYLQFCEQVSK